MATDMSQLLRHLEARKWKLSVTGGGHVRAQAPDGKTTIFLPSTPSDWRSLKNVVAALRRSGEAWPPPPRRRRKRDVARP